MAIITLMKANAIDFLVTVASLMPVDWRLNND